jgi:hypothetical protein
MTVFTTEVDVVDGDNGEQLRLDTISWRGMLWLVPNWRASKTAGKRQPVRIIRPHLFQFEKTRPGQAADYSLACSISKAVLDGLSASEATKTFDIVEAPPIEFPIPMTPKQ